MQAHATGLDYSESGIRNCQALFSALSLDIDLRRDDFFNNGLPKQGFDVVASFGFIEHFDDPREAVAKHIELVRPGGIALITVPNYGGLYGSLQRWCDPVNLALHNLEIMNPAALCALVDHSKVQEVKAYPFGFMSLFLVNMERKLPRGLTTLIQFAFNAMGLIQFLPIRALCPMLVLEVRTKFS